ncbi:uncharacterized protein ANIA_08968 [Aspergillus nidulans FGSC A4]|uniref:Isoflavone reductase family protein (AFU_orthologue AFUA_1G12510) n=1 Tax=Emericella nidulans (strain FGSC A4 / ATCC 38163 / CBS 112.46 / NRRL 194 / M139) TaxID=227321 RepID=C8VL85_EMENI|nr:hypothetical protein [Aspergillus nidulans FGSC A4]CBF84548.1 TPA: isoflavone reductase family protein (AFU_orthologue; AFUA_1G12510) [Aspergillus nidulans FGSC A4]
MTKSNLLIFGATGAIGSYITAAITDARDEFGRIGIFTSQSTLTKKTKEINALREKAVDILVGDVTSKDEVLKAFDGFDTVVSALGRGVIAQQVHLVQWADESPQIKRFLPSEYGTDIEYSLASANEKPHQQKLKVRAAIRETKNLEYAFVVTGPYADVPFYLGASKNPRGGSFDVKNKKAVLLGDGNGRISLVACADVGKFVVHTLTHWDKARGRALKLNSFTTTPNDILAEFEKQTGNKWSVEYTSLKQLKQYEKEAWEKGEPDATTLTLRRIWTEGGTLYERRDNEDIGAENTTTLEEAVNGAIKTQLGQ